MSGKYVLAVSGSRHFNNYGQFSKAVDSVLAVIGRPELVISGECRGTDQMAELYCVEKNIPYEIFHAEWDVHGKKAGPLRNALLVKHADALIAFTLPDSRGTCGTIRLAREAGMEKVFVFELQRTNCHKKQ